MAKQVICDNCGAVIKEQFDDYHGDLSPSVLAVIKIKPVLLNRTNDVIENPDLCRACIIRTLKG